MWWSLTKSISGIKYKYLSDEVHIPIALFCSKILRVDKKEDSFEKRLEKDMLQDHITALYAPRIIAEVC